MTPAELRKLADDIQTDAARYSAIEPIRQAADEIERLHDLHYERTKSTENIILERDAFKDQYAKAVTQLTEIYARHVKLREALTAECRCTPLNEYPHCAACEALADDGDGHE